MSNSLVAYDMHLYWMKVDEKTFQFNPIREFVIRYSGNIEALVRSLEQFCLWQVWLEQEDNGSMDMECNTKKQTAWLGDGDGF